MPNKESQETKERQRVMRETCERCTERPIRGEKFCSKHKEIVLKEMVESGYLKPPPFGFTGTNRPAEMRELTYETKNGLEHG
ncbi:MAG: hypothetical protein CMP95_02810 [Gammaproteobacteria bacterium]|nr:hypothetical protein [Gammaproteobacteria bacterium]